jgi:nucleoid-associated protein YgaU
MNKKSKLLRRSAAALVLAATSATMIAPASHAADVATWEKLAQCESGGNWSINTGNGFYGGLQFTQQSWNGVGMSGSPQYASREAQIEAGERLLAIQGWGAWPACSAKLGLSGAATPTYTDPSNATVPSTTVVAPQSSSQTPVASNTYTAPVAPVAQSPVAAPAPAVEPPVASTPETPAPTTTVEPAVVSQPVPVVQAPKVASSTYEVVSGDTLSLIAAKLGVAGGYKAIADANVDVIYDVNLIFPGQVLNIP